jgi:PAS domain S-box-containing protein
MTDLPMRKIAFMTNTTPEQRAAAEPTGGRTTAVAGDPQLERPGRRAGGAWGLESGESVIAGMAVAALAILLVALGAGGWWAARAHHRQAEAARFEQVRVVVDLLARNAEPLMASGELTALRRMLIEARAQNGLARSRIVLPDGRVVADSEPGGITAGAAALPASWPAGPLDAVGSSLSDAAGRSAEGAPARFVRSLMVTGRGPATLEVSAELGAAGSVAGTWEFATGQAALGVGTLGLLWAVYRHLRNRVRALGLIRDALVAVGRGERSADVLTLDPKLGTEAGAWNELLRERSAARRETVAAGLSEKLERRREPRGELELACDSLSVGLAVVDEHGRVRHANGAAASLLRIRREEMAGRPLADVLPAGDEQGRAAVADLAAGRAAQRRTWEVAAGEAGAQVGVLRLTLRPLRREDASAALLTVEDVTQQRVADASRSAFVAQATHELRTPLTNMRLCIETALEETEPDPAEIAKAMGFLNGEVRRLERMVGEMLSVSEIEAGSLKLHADDVRLDAMFGALRDELAPLAAEKRVELAFDLPPKLPVIVGDRDKLVLALHNLVGNAIKYTPEGGMVTVTVRADGRRVAVEVADTGIGIRAEEQEKVFERFYRAKDPRVAKITGTGLGLALSREVARVHGGDVTVQSEVDKGSTFTLTVPVGKAA